MARRQDGVRTRERLLQAACEVFAAKGYHGATVAEISRRARANVAAVNYYFGGKASLYLETWKHAFEASGGPQIPGPEGNPPEERLRGLIHSMVRQMTVSGELELFARLYLMEQIHPTGLVDELWHQLIEPRRRPILELIGQIMELPPTDQRVLFCDVSLVSQCSALLRLRPADIENFLGEPMGPGLVHRLADHIYKFSLAGMREVAAQGKK